jgi:hypothetical protein
MSEDEEERSGMGGFRWEIKPVTHSTLEYNSS